MHTGSPLATIKGIQNTYRKIHIAFIFIALLTTFRAILYITKCLDAFNLYNFVNEKTAFIQVELVNEIKMRFIRADDV